MTYTNVKDVNLNCKESIWLKCEGFLVQMNSMNGSKVSVTFQPNDYHVYNVLQSCLMFGIPKTLMTYDDNQFLL